MTGKRQKVKNMSPKQRAAAMISVRQQHGQRTQRAITMDARKTAQRVYDPDTDDLHPWQNRPNRCDVEGVDTRTAAAVPTVAKTAPVEKPKPKSPKTEKPETKSAKKDEMEREIVYDRVSKYGKGIGWYRVVKLPGGEYGIHEVQLIDGKEQEAYAGREESLNTAKMITNQYMQQRESNYTTHIDRHRARLQDILVSQQTRIHAYNESVISQYTGYVTTCNERVNSADTPIIASRYTKHIAAAERKIANTKRKQKHLEKLWEQHDKKDKLYLYGNKKLTADARLVLKEDFGITDADADKLFTPNLKLEYTNSTRFAGRCFSTCNEGFPKIQISSLHHNKNKDIKEDRKYRATMIHELIHHMRLWELDRAKFSAAVQHKLLYDEHDRSEEERRTVMETQLRGAPDYCNTSKDSYYSFLKDLPPNAGEEDNKTLTNRDDVGKVISTKKVSKHLNDRGADTYISRLHITGNARWIDRTQITSEGDIARTYDPKARKPNMKADARELDAEDGETGEEDVYEIMQDGTKKLILKRRRR